MEKNPVRSGVRWVLLQKNPVRYGTRWTLLQKNPVWSGDRCPPPVDRDRGPEPHPVCFLDFTKCHHGLSDDETEWNSESGEDDGDGPRCEDEVEEVIQPTSVAGDSTESILLLPINYGTVRS